MHNDRFPKGFTGMSRDRMGISEKELDTDRHSASVGKGAGPHSRVSVTSSDDVVLPPAPATDRGRVTGRLRPVTRSPAQEFELRQGQCRKIPKALEIALMGATTTAPIHRNGISFTPKLLNPQGKTKRLTWWRADSPVCQVANIGKKVTVAYDPLDCSFIHVLDANGKYLDTLPLKDKTPWFDPEETARAIADTKRIASRVSGQLQHLHSAAAEAAAEAARSNKAKIENIVQTFPKEGHRTAPAKPSENAVAIGAAHASAKQQKSRDDIIEAEIEKRMREEGEAAAELLAESEILEEPAEQENPPEDTDGIIDLIL